VAPSRSICLRPRGSERQEDRKVCVNEQLSICTTDPLLRYVDYFMHRVRMLQYYGIEPVIVFDGGPLPAKKGTEHLRKKYV